jgi:hypothetical protein
VHLTNVIQGERWMQRLHEPSVDPQVTAAISRAAQAATNERDRQNLLYENQANSEQSIIGERLAAWLPNALWLLMPLFALLLAPLFGRRRLFMEHLVFAMWAHVVAFVLLIALTLANRLGAAWPVVPIVVPYLGYVVFVARRYYGLSWPQAVWRSAAHTASYLFLVLAPAAIVVALASMDLSAFWAFMMAA